jgi:RNA polymerase sigma-70 factor (ECF subfamily)
MPTALDLFERHHLAVFRFLRRLDGTGRHAEDLTQEVFLRVVRALHTYEERQLEKAWIFRIARNVWLDHCRGAGRRRDSQPLDEGPVLSVAARQGIRLALDEALGQLGETEREAFLMREVGGLGYVEIAEALAITPGAARNRIHRARLALRLLLAVSRPMGSRLEG